MTSSSPAAVRKLRLAARARGYKVEKFTRHLGVDYNPASVSSSLPVLAARRTVAKSRQQRIGAVTRNRKAISRITSSTLAAWLAYGAATRGRTDKQLKYTDSLAHSLLGPARGRSAFARLTLRAKGLPSTPAAVAAPAAWARAVFDESVETHTLAAAWRHANLRCTAAPGTDVTAQGPAEATWRSLERIGWRFPDPTTLLTEDNVLLDLKREAPKAIEHTLARAYEKAMATRSTVAKRIGQTPWLEPLLDHTRASSTTADAAASLAALAEGAWITQTSVVEAGKASDDTCRACKADKGTFLHRVTSCRCGAATREKATGSATGA